MTPLEQLNEYVTEEDQDEWKVEGCVQWGWETVRLKIPRGKMMELNGGIKDIIRPE